MMTTETIEVRIAMVESELSQIKQQLAAEKPPAAPARWEKIFGSFADSEGFDEAARLGREYREGQGAKEDKETS